MLTAGALSAMAALPDPLYEGPVNYTGSANGSFSYNEGTGEITVHGCGSDIWGTSDSFYYVYTAVETDTDFDYVIKATNFAGESNEWMKAGLMARASIGYTWDPETGEVNGLDMEGGARYFCVQTQKTSGSANTKWITQWRPTVDQDVNDNTSKRYGNYTWPQWLRLRKIGHTYYGIVSSDGENWEKLWSEDSDTWEEGPLVPYEGATPLAVGLFVTSHNADSNDAILTAYDFQAFPQTPVAFEHAPEDKEITAGTTYKLEAKVSGYNPFTYVWKKDGKVIAQGTELFANSFSYKIEGAKLSDSGTYTLEVTNTANGQTTTKTASAKLTVVTDVKAPEILSVQAFENTVGITFNETVDSASATQAANYAVSGKTVTQVEQRTGDRVTLILNSKVDTGATVDVTVKNVADLSGNKITETTATAAANFALSITGKPFTPGYAEAMGGDGFFINNQGLMNWGNYDEDTFVYKTFTGDFDIRMRILDQSYTTQWARAGLQIRTALDAGKAAPHSAYMEIHHCPMKVMSWDDATASYTDPVENIHGLEQDDYRYAIESNARLANNGDTGGYGNTRSFIVDGVRTTPGDFYLNDGEMWLRIGRVGKVINAYYGIKSGGQIDWTRINSQTINDLGAVAYAGPHYGVEGKNFIDPTTASLTNEFKNPTSYFFMSAANYEEGYLEPVALQRSPVSKNIKAPAPFSLTVTATGDPITYQWYKDGQPIEGAIFATYTVDPSKASDSGVYYCEIMNFGSGAPDKGTSVISESATVVVEEDTTAPYVTGCSYYPGDKAVTLTFSETMDATSVNTAANYTVVDPNGKEMPINSLTVSNNYKTAHFYCNGLEDGVVYNVVLGKITDPSGNEVTHTDVTFTTTVYMNGIIMNYYNYASDTMLGSLDDFITTVGNGTAPSEKIAFDYLEIPSARGDYYCVFVKGLLVPPETGNYRFAVASDDQSRLYLSTDASPANKTLVAEEPSWCNSRGFDTGAGGNEAPTQSGDIYLEAGKYYYFEGYMREATGGDNFAIAWSLPSQGPTRIPDQATPISSAYVLDVDVEVNPSNTVLEIVSQPPATVTAYENGAATLPVEVKYSSDLGDVAPSYTWYVKNDLSMSAWMPVSSVAFTDPTSVSGANTSTLQFKNLQGWEHSGIYRLDMVLAGKSLSSQEITLNVVSDTEAPTAKVKGNNTMENLTVEFSEVVSGLDDPSSYIIDGLTVLNATADETMTIAFLQTTRQEEGKVYNVKFQNIFDSVGNMIPASYAASFTSFVWVPGYTLLECFDEEAAVADLYDAVFWTPELNAYQLPPQVANYVEITSSTFNQDNCTERVSGYLVPAESGTYEFAGSCDDDFKLWISPTESIYDMSDSVVCWEQGWNPNGERVYDWSGASGTYGTTPIDLQAGQKYFFTVALHEAGGGDFVSLTWRLLPNPMQANKTAPILTGDLLGMYVDGDACQLTITKQPEDVSGKAGDSVRVSVEATTVNPLNAPISYQWYLNDQPVDGATAAAMTFTLTPEMNGALAYCALTIPGKTANTHEAKITVEADSEQVYPVSVSGVNNTVVVAFDKPVDPESATNIANYIVAGATVESAAMHANSENVVELKVSGDLNDIILVTVSNVKNLSGLPMSAPVTLEGGYCGMDYTVLNPSGAATAYATVGTDGTYTLHAGGGDYWGNSEVGCLFLYEEVEGDFDVVLCVEDIENNNVWSKAGLAFRATLDANSPHASMLATPVRVQMTYRPTAGETSLEDSTIRNYGDVTYPSNWIRLKRVGNLFTAYRSLDGNYWTYVGEVTEAKAQLPAAGYLGIVYSTQDQDNYHTAVVSGYNSQYVAPALPTPDPSDYTFTMVGYQDGGVEGFYDYDAETGMFSVWGCGSDVWGTEDHFSFLYRPAPEGDFSLTVKLNDFPATSNGWAKAGLMVRESAADGVTFPNDSRYVVMHSQRAYNTSNGDFRSAWRPTIGLNVDDAHSMSGPAYRYPCWMRLAREGTATRGYISYDGVNWEQYLETYTGEWLDGDLGTDLPLYIGMFVTSHDQNSSDACAYFSDVTFVGGDVPPPVTDLELAYSIEGEDLVLRWEAATGASLEVAPTADSANWTIIEGELVGGAYQARVPMAQAAGFYRLVK
jgi:hypothetical protein